MPIVQPSITKSSSSSRAPGGDAGSQTPRCSATLIRCIYYGVWKNTCHKWRVRTTTTTTTPSSHWVHKSTFLFRVNLTGACMWANDVVAHAQGAAWRRRQRRLRAHWRHEQLTLQMLLATYDHHAAPRGQSRARSGGGHEMYYTAAFRGAPPPQGSRPPCLGEPRGPQARIQQRTMEQLADVCPWSRFWIFLCRRWLNSCRTSCASSTRFCLFPSRLSKCPRSCSMTSPVRDTQLVEPPVEVPTIISYSSLQRTTEQHVDIPVPRRGVRHPGLQDLLSGQSSTASQLALERISERISEQIVDFPVSRGGLQDFRLGQGSILFFACSSSRTRRLG